MKEKYYFEVTKQESHIYTQFFKIQREWSFWWLEPKRVVWRQLTRREQPGYDRRFNFWLYYVRYVITSSPISITFDSALNELVCAWKCYDVTNSRPLFLAPWLLFIIMSNNMVNALNWLLKVVHHFATCISRIWFTKKTIEMISCCLKEKWNYCFLTLRQYDQLLLWKSAIPSLTLRRVTTLGSFKTSIQYCN